MLLKSQLNEPNVGVEFFSCDVLCLQK